MDNQVQGRDEQPLADHLLLRPALNEAEKVIREYHTALNGLQRLAGKAEVNYDKILSQHEMVASNEKMKELEAKHKERLLI